MPKKISLCIIAFFFALSGFTQDEPTDYTNRDPREREKTPQMDRMNFVPSEVLVKFKVRNTNIQNR